MLSGRPDAEPAEEFTLSVKALPEVCTILSGPCLQFWLGRRLLVARLRAAGGAGPSYGLTGLQPLVDAPLDVGPTNSAAAGLTALLGRASNAWNTIASGPVRADQRLTEAEAQGVGAGRGARSGGGGGAGWGPSREAAAASREPPAAWAPPCMPYTAVQVFDLVHDALVCAVRLGGPDSVDNTLVQPAVLLMHLALEHLRPAAAAERLPGLWRSLAALLQFLGPTERVHPSPLTVLCSMGRLLRLRLPDDLPAGAPAAASPPGCSFSLRCALDGGLLPALEQLLRRLASAGPGDEAATELFFYAFDTLLRHSGVWPAVLAHGSVREVASLMLTLRKAAVALGDACLVGAPTADCEDAIVGFPLPQWGRQGLLTAYVAALLEQTLAVLLSPPESGELRTGTAANTATGVSGRSDSDSSGAEESSGRGVGGGGGSGASGPGLQHSDRTARQEEATLPDAQAQAPSTKGPDAYLLLNRAFSRAGAFFDRLLRAGGRPTHGSPAAQQQRLLASLELMLWSPFTSQPLGAGIWWAPAVAALDGRCHVAMSAQCVKTLPRRRQHVPSPAAAAAEPQHAAAAAASGVHGSSAAGDAADAAATAGPDGMAAEHAAWLRFRPPSHTAVRWAALGLADALSGRSVHGLTYGLISAAMIVATSPVGAVQEAAKQFLGLCDAPGEPAVSGAAAEGAPGGPACAAAATPSELRAERARRLRSLLLHVGEHSLVAVLEAAEPEFAQLWREEAGAGDSSGSGSSGVGGGAAGCAGDGATVGSSCGGSDGPPQRAVDSTLPELLEKLALDNLALSDMARLPALPSPAAALRAVEGAGVGLCGNPACLNLEGPSEAWLFGRKTCGRCRAVRYCSGACQLAHWRAGHASECAGSARVQAPERAQAPA